MLKRPFSTESLLLILMIVFLKNTTLLPIYSLYAKSKYNCGHFLYIIYKPAFRLQGNLQKPLQNNEKTSHF